MLLRQRYVYPRGVKTMLKMLKWVYELGYDAGIEEGFRRRKKQEAEEKYNRAMEDEIRRVLDDGL